MPYTMEKRGNKYVVMNMDTKEVKGRHATKAKAMAQMRLLYGIMHGMESQK